MRNRTKIALFIFCLSLPVAGWGNEDPENSDNALPTGGTGGIVRGDSRVVIGTKPGESRQRVYKNPNKQVRVAPNHDPNRPHASQPHYGNEGQQGGSGNSAESQ